MAAPKPCLQCGVLVRDGTSRCQAHKRKAWSKPTGERSLGGRPWRRLRDAVLQRDCGLCQPSLRHGLLVAAETVDHIVPRSRGGSDDLDNLQAVSLVVHEAKSAAERAGQVWDEDAWFATTRGGGQKFGARQAATDPLVKFSWPHISGRGGSDHG